MTNHVPPFLLQLLERELASGERVIWQAMPVPASRVKASLSAFLQGILLFAFATFWTMGVWPNWGGIFMGGMFMLFTGNIVLSPFWAWWEARRTIYVITDRRALLIEARYRKRTIQSFTGERLATVIRREDKHGHGEIIFEREASKGSKGRSVYRDIGFFGLDDAKSVEALLRQTHAGAFQV